MKKINDFLNRELKGKSTVVIACSGGPDSMCLLALLCNLKDEKDLKIVVAHVNHKIRIESEFEENMVKEYALKNDCIIEVKHLDEFIDGDFSEELARNKRYSFFEETIEKYNANYLLTAHHGDDLIETILMRLTRGSNLKGYMGMRQISQKQNYILLRPLLTITKQEIMDYLKINKIPYAIDKTNESDKYTRNRYRKNVLSFLKKEEQNIHEKYLQFSNELSEYNDFVNEYINKNKFIVDNMLDINKIKNESSFIKRKSLELIIRNIQDNDYFDISSAQMNEALKLIDNRKSNISINMNNGYKCVKEYMYLKIVKDNTKIEDYKFLFDKEVKYDNWLITSVTDSDKETNFEIRLNSEEIKLPLIIRNRKTGDKLEVKNLNGSKKIKDVFIDEKVAIEKRDVLPIVTDSNDVVLWIPGIKKSKFAKDKTEKYDIILKYEVINK